MEHINFFQLSVVYRILFRFFRAVLHSFLVRKSMNYPSNYRGRPNYPPNHKTGHSSSSTTQTGQIIPLDPIRGGFGTRDVRVAAQSALYL